MEEWGGVFPELLVGNALAGDEFNCLVRERFVFSPSRSIRRWYPLSRQTMEKVGFEGRECIIPGCNGKVKGTFSSTGRLVRVVSRSDSALLLSELRVVLSYILPSLPLDSPRRPALVAPGAKSHLGILLIITQPYSRGISTAQSRSSVIIGKRALNRPIATRTPIPSQVLSPG